MHQADLTEASSYRGVGSFIAFVVVFFLVFGLIAQILCRHGILWHSFSASLSKVDRNQFQAALFKIDAAGSGPRRLVIGDRRFLEHSVIPSADAQTLRILVPLMHPAALGAFLRRIAPGRVSEIIVQLDPRFWSNARFRIGRMNFRFWDAARQRGYRIYPRHEVKIVFDTLLAVIKANDGWRSVAHHRPKNLKALRFRGETSELKALREALADHIDRGAKVTWLLDETYHEKTENSELLKQIEGLFAGKQHREVFGQLKRL